MKPIRIICAVTNDLSHDRRMDRICRTLTEGGYQVTLVGRQLPDSAPLKPAPYSVKRVKCFFNTGALFYLEYNVRLWCWLMLQSFAMVCACDLDTALAVRGACWIRRKKTVLDAHEYFTESPELNGRPLIKRVWEWIGYLTVRGFDVRYTVGECLAKIMTEKYRVPFQVIRNIAPRAEAEKVVTNILHRDKILLYQGALNVGRGLELMIGAMTQLPDWQLWLAGEGDITKELKRITKELGLDARVKFLGWVSPDQLPSLMARAKLSINLRDAGSLNDYYSLPNKFFDALHAGLPSLHMNYPEYNAICAVYPCAILLEELSENAITKAIASIDDHPEQLEQMAKACRAASQELNWENESVHLLEIYRGLAK